MNLATFERATIAVFALCCGALFLLCAHEQAEESAAAHELVAMVGSDTRQLAPDASLSSLPAACVAPPAPLQAVMVSYALPQEGVPPLALEAGIINASAASVRPVYDAFLFSGELDLLELRLLELGDVVDFFVLLEQPLTSFGTPKPMHYSLSRHEERFARYRRQIISIGGSVPADVVNGMAREAASRALLLHTVRLIAPPEALILFSDVDEIFSCWTVDTLRRSPGMPNGTFVHVLLPQFFYSFRWRQRNDFSYSKAFLRSYLDVYPYNANSLFYEYATPHYELRNEGWHCSYCMPSEQLVEVRKLGILTQSDVSAKAGARLPYGLRAFADRFGPLFLPEA